jgi:ectoine hydroxylase-related dioxygenase (phytanoyl-CoA dioxygenase family)
MTTETMETSIEVRHFDLSDGPDAIMAGLLADGAVVVENFLTAEQVAAVNAELGPYIEAADPTMKDIYDFDFGMTEADTGVDDMIDEGFRSGNTKNITGLTTKSPTFASDLLLHPLFLALCDQFLLPHCQDYVLNHSHVINPGPGAKAQPIHRDEGVFARATGLGVGSHLQLSSIVALCDFTAENGATQVVVGSHLWEGDPFGTTGRQPQPEEIRQAVMPAGSVVLYLGWTFHGAGHNQTTDTWRRGLHVSYCQGWLRTEENNTLATPPDVARHLPKRAQELLGYGVHTGTGMLALRSPIDQMADGAL